ncbi:MAG: PilZ domain-containing protein [Magnetococcus sp. MYC-9]
MNAGDGKRREDRLLGSEPAVMVMTDGRKATGLIGNMSLGGMLFVADDTTLVLEKGSLVDIVLTLYGRESQFTCSMAHQKGNQFGLQLHRS